MALAPEVDTSIPFDMGRGRAIKSFSKSVRRTLWRNPPLPVINPKWKAKEGDDTGGGFSRDPAPTPTPPTLPPSSPSLPQIRIEDRSPSKETAKPPHVKMYDDYYGAIPACDRLVSPSAFEVTGSIYGYHLRCLWCLLRCSEECRTSSAFINFVSMVLETQMGADEIAGWFSDLGHIALVRMVEMTQKLELSRWS
jgi:hypothetical protein